MTAADIPAGLRLCRASGWNQLAIDWERFLAMSPSGCRVALDHAREVVGTVATVRYGRAFAWIAMVLVDPRHRRAGIGTRLLEDALHLVDDVATVRLDATPAGFRVYEPLGFREERRLQRMKRDGDGLAEAGHNVPTPYVVSGFSRTVVRPMRDEDLQEVFAWDKQIFGADRHALLHSFRRQAPTYAWIAGERHIEGYTFGRSGHAFEHLGPVIAQSEDRARQLVGACLEAHGRRPFIIDVATNSTWVTWLESIGFGVQRPFIRMFRGDPTRHERPQHTFAIAGPEFG
jgi:GNAT superfamily N-acetyltransferase